MYRIKNSSQSRHDITAKLKALVTGEEGRLGSESLTLGSSSSFLTSSPLSSNQTKQNEKQHQERQESNHGSIELTNDESSLNITDRRSSFSSSRQKNEASNPYESASNSHLLTRDTSIVIDRLDVRFAKVGVYGRENEVKRLNDIFEVVCSGELPFAMVLISGYAGTGKSAIVNHFHKKLLLKATQVQQQDHRRPKFFFASGKFDPNGLNRHTKPYAAIISAFAQLSKDIQALANEDNPREIQEEYQLLCRLIRAAVGNSEENLAMLVDIMPDLENIMSANHTDRSSIINQKDEEQILSDDTLGGQAATDESKIPRKDRSNNLNSERNKKRFTYILRRFVRAMCTPSRPFILHLDDLQWADADSLELLELLVNDPELYGLLVIGCHRDNEVHDAHPLSIKLQAIEQHHMQLQQQDQDYESKSSSKSSVPMIQRILIGNLDKDVIHDLLSDVLDHPKSQKTEGLCDILYEKTHGNIYFTIQLLQTLQEQKLLNYNFGSYRWQWDESKIRSNASISDNVADLLKNKLQKQAPQPVLQVLQLASCLGSEFDRTTIELLARSVLELSNTGATNNDEHGDKHEADGCLEIAVREGLIIDCVETYRFSHDEIQSAAYSLIPDIEREQLHLKIGHVLVDEFTGNDQKFDEMLFVIVDLLNNGSRLLINGCTDDYGVIDCSKLAELNLRASCKAMKSTAFASAAEYASRGIQLLEPNHWDTQKDLSLDLYNSAIRAESSESNNEKVKQCINLVLQQRQQGKLQFEDTVVAYSSLVDYLGARSRLEESISVALEVLSKLGASLSTLFGKASVASKMLKTNQLVDAKICGSGVSVLAELPSMTDDTKSKAMELMGYIKNYAYDSQQNLRLATICEMVQWSIKYGISRVSPSAFAGFGIVVQCVFGDFKKGGDFANLALKLGEDPSRDQSNLSEAIFQCYFFIKPWKQLFSLCRKPLFRGYQIGLATGDHPGAMWCIYSFILMGWYTGDKLSLTEADFRTYMHQMKELGQKRTLDKALGNYKMILTLMGRPEPDLSNFLPDSDDTESSSKATRNNQLEDQHNFLKLYIAFHFGEYDKAAKLVEQTQTIYKTNVSGPNLMRYILFEGLVAFAVIHKAKNNKKSNNLNWTVIRWKLHGNKVLRKVAKWVAHGNPNLIHVLHLLEAERFAIDDKTTDAKKKYDLAISSAARHGFRCDRALANELAGEMFLREGIDTQRARDYLEEAYRLYVEWEAYGKADQVVTKYPAILSDVSRSLPPLPNISSSIPS